MLVYKIDLLLLRDLPILNKSFVIEEKSHYAFYPNEAFLHTSAESFLYAFIPNRDIR
jgi:hypothetical protein